MRSTVPVLSVFFALLSAGLGFGAPQQRSAPAPLLQADIERPAPRAPAPLPDAPRIVPPLALHPDVSVPRPADERVALGLDFSEVRYQHGPDGALWARGESYKARFDSEGASVIPAFGSRAPRNFDLRFELEQVLVGGEPFELAPQADVRRSADVVTLDRGALDETYHLEVRQLEQRFTFESLAQRGELELRLALDSELVGALDPAGGLRFSNEWGSVHYGAAIAFDAAGRRVDVETTLEDGALTLRVPERFVAQAQLPLTIDPLITVFALDNSTSECFDADSAYNLAGDALLHVYSVLFSANDFDVAGFATNRNGVVLFGSFFWTDFTSQHWREPRVAHNAVSDRFLVIGLVGPTGAQTVWGHVRSVFQNFLSTPAELSGPEVGDKYVADVGGDPYLFPPSYFCIVYQRTIGLGDFDINARLIDTNGVPAGAGTIFVDGSVGTFDINPSISKTNGGGNWNVVWERRGPNASSAIRGAKVNWNGTISLPSFEISSVAQAQWAPTATGPVAGSERFFVACTRYFGTDADIMVFLVNGNVREQELALSSAFPATLFQDQRSPSIETDGAHALVAWSEIDQATSSHFDLFASEIYTTPTGMGIKENRIVISTSTAQDYEPQVCSPESSNPAQSTQDYSVSWYEGGSFFNDNVWCALVRGSVGGPVSLFCTQADYPCPCGDSGLLSGCPNSQTSLGAHMSTSGGASTLAPTLSLNIERMKPNATSLVFQGTGVSGGPLGDGVRCVYGTVIRFAPHTNNVFGATVYPGPGEPSLAVLGQIPLQGGTFYYQTWYRDTAAFCTSAATNLSDALSVTWTY
jgi:hypothetical protein